MDKMVLEERTKRFNEFRKIFQKRYGSDIVGIDKIKYISAADLPDWFIIDKVSEDRNRQWVLSGWAEKDYNIYFCFFKDGSCKIKDDYFYQYPYPSKTNCYGLMWSRKYLNRKDGSFKNKEFEYIYTL